MDKIKFNAMLLFRKGGQSRCPRKVVVGNAVVKLTNSYKYLGMIFITKLSVNTALSETCRKGKKGCSRDSDINHKIKYS